MTSDRELIPDPRTATDGMLGIIARRIDATNDLLASILDRLPSPAQTKQAGDGEVELSEPKKPPARNPAARKTTSSNTKAESSTAEDEPEDKPAAPRARRKPPANKKTS